MSEQHLNTLPVAARLLEYFGLCQRPGPTRLTHNSHYIDGLQMFPLPGLRASSQVLSGGSSFFALSLSIAARSAAGKP
jgi:hypothetical protein